MNIKNIIVGSLAVGLAIGGTFLKLTSQEEKSVYVPRNIENGVSGQAGYAEYLHMLKADPATGEIDYNLVSQTRKEVIARSKQNNKAALGLNWTQLGPDNVGGRTRAILVDQSNPNIVYAGSIAGGLFVSTDATATWTPVAGHDGVLGENLAISCITQTDNGRIFFGTGASFENAFGTGGSGFIGNGVYEYVPSTGQILPVITTGNSLPNNNPGDQLSIINAIAHYGNRLYIGTKDGMLWADPDGAGLYPTSISGWFNPIEVIPGIPETTTCQDIDVASDGGMLVSFGGRFYVSPNDAFGSFVKTNVSGGRLSGAIAPSNPNVYYMLRSNSILSGLDISIDKGVTWSTIVPGGSGCLDPFRQNDCGTQYAQGGYDDAIAVDPGDWGHILVGGVQLFEWRLNASSNPIGGSWVKSANLFESGSNPYYVHADKHTIVWPDASTVYIGCDGGVFKSTNNGTTWQERNLGYNVTTFYDAQVAANGMVMGGAQDNGTQLWAFGGGTSTPLGTIEVMGGDGFDVAFSNFGPGIGYATSQNGSLMRFAQNGGGGSFYSGYLNGLIGAGNEPFHTVIENWEKSYDPLSVDSIEVTFPSPVTYNAGDTMWYSSLTNDRQLPFVFTTATTLDSTDTLVLQDYVQNKFALATSAGVYLTRDAARLGSPNPQWFRVSSRTNIECMEFSPDGNHLFLGTTLGQIYRVSDLSMANDSMGLSVESGAAITTETMLVNLGGVVTGLAADPNDGNNMIATTGGYTTGNHVHRSTNALGAGNFTAIQGSTVALPKMPVYDAEIDYNDNDKVIIGTEWGVWTTDNAFSAASGALVEWTDESGNGMAHVPVFAVEQQHLRSNQSMNSGFVYLGTHGRGFYMAADLFTAVDETDTYLDDDKFISNLSVYPNPMNTVGTVSFDLEAKSDTEIKIYNLSGSLVKRMDLGSMTKGQHKVQLDVSSLSVGSYIISLESGSERNVSKFIVTR